ncbi:hypothetical protein BI343_10635 [Chromobacterium amazonense]|uniref:Solute-binding protein family 3/N-terminal domain-containing protein n=1 Tax=Chromobacterium amazonense TaxID=1382803 RepID=A0A1S1XCE9_9NEIS|nr:hypothetical protein BI343_10635 [Chromobacterium amazonense]PRP70198.1 hypothetical protein BUE93_13255 [Chromobacterium amazonense]
MSVGWDEWPPFHYLGRDEQVAGYSVALLNQAAARLGCSMNYQRLPWPRTLQQLRLGQLDAAMQALKTPEREAYACFVQGYSPTLVQLWARRDRMARWPVRKLEDLGRLGHLRLGVTRGDSYGDTLDHWLQAPPPSVSVDVGETLDGSFRKLQLGRIDLLLATSITAQREVARLPQSPQMVALPPKWLAGQAYYVFSRRSVSARQCRAFADALQAMRQDGTVARLYRSQFAVPYPER